MKENRDEVFSYIFSKADDVGYMALDSAMSGKFQDDLENDPELIKIAGGRLSRKYIKDTVLNNYSKKQRYISETDVLSVFIESENMHIAGAKKDLENGVFSVFYEGHEFKSTSSSINEWQTVIKRFGKRAGREKRFAFLTCGGIEKKRIEVESVKDTLKSYGVDAFVVKPSQDAVSIKSFAANIKNMNTGPVQSIMLSKSFILLAGISGTGKTRFVRNQADLTGSIEETYCLTSVRPDWHEPSDLLGYVSRLGTKPQYIATDVLRFIVRAWREIIESIERDKDGMPVDWQGRDLGDIRVFWLCLDEMNLAPVEQYFADYLSILETRRWNDPEKLKDSEFDYIYECDPLVKGGVFSSLDTGIYEADEKPSTLLAKDLGFNLSESLDKDIWDYFLSHGISIPFNLIVAGTVNMDETTHGFSRKVIDRALSFDFGNFFPNDYNDFFSQSSRNKSLSYPVWSHACQTDLASTYDADGAKSISFLNSVNSVLKKTPFELAYRALNELLLSVVSAQPQDEVTLTAVWDDFLMCKVLPRIEGDVDKLGGEPSLLKRLETVLLEQLSLIWHEEKGSDNARPDLYREKYVRNDTFDEGEVIRIACRSKDKIKWMNDRLLSAGFTSFWP